MNSEVINLTSDLLKSAKERGTLQGQVICEQVLSKLTSNSINTDVIKVLKVLNKSYVGIEAHGHLTKKEFTIVIKLRQLEQKYS